MGHRIECGKVSSKTHYKANRKPVHLGRASEIRANIERGEDFRKGREICFKVAPGRPPRTKTYNYNVWVERKPHWEKRKQRK